MILSDQYRFVFVHIPKCAGTSVRKAVLSFHDADNRFLKTIEVHPELGQIDYRHLPLVLLRELDREAFEKLKIYSSYALLRDPFQRFRSAIAQRAKMYVGTELAQLGDEDLETEIKRVISYLQSGPEVITSDFIHFARQSDFVQLDGERIVHNLYPVERLDLFVETLSRHIGADKLEIGHANKTQVLRHPQLKNVLYSGSAFVRRVLPASLHESLRYSARRVLMKSGDSAEFPVFDAPYVQDFIRQYYAADIALHQEVLADAAA